jgi:hypothetical protein
MLNNEKWTTEGDMYSKEEKLKRFPQGNLAHGQSPRIKGDDSKFLNGGWCHIFDKRKVNNLKLSSLLT